MKKKIRNYIKTILVILIIIAFSFLLIVKIFDLHEHQSQFKKYNQIAKIDPSKQKIEEWMSPAFISQNYNISPNILEQRIGIKISIKEFSRPLSKLCNKKQINCSEIIQNLNSESNK